MKNIKLYPCFKHWLEYDSIWIISDTHFDDFSCKYIDPNWITPEEHIQILKKELNKQTLLIHLGDVGDASYLDELKCYKVLITGNHDILSKVSKYFDEVYIGPLFIADRILLSHEPIYGLENFCCNIHGHNHAAGDELYMSSNINHINLAANVYNYQVFNLSKEIKNGLLSQIKNYHRTTIDNATTRKQKRKDDAKYFGEDFAQRLDEIYRKQQEKDNYFIKQLLTPSKEDNYYVPDACKFCSNHPSNGGSGICNCTLGLSITY